MGRYCRIPSNRRWALEEALVAAGACAALVRTPEEWLAHPQQIAVASLPLLEIIPLGGSAPEPLPVAQRPLSGIRVLDLARILAGPVATRCMAAFGALAALARRARHGGSYLVRVSLAQTGHWFKTLGRTHASVDGEPGNGDVADLMETRSTAFGAVEHLGANAARLAETPCHWALPPVPLGAHDASWHPRVWR